MEVTYKAPGYRPEAVRRRYVRKNIKGENYSWYEVGDDPRYDIRQGLVEAYELPEEVRAGADRLYRTWPGCVDWPIS